MNVQKAAEYAHHTHATQPKIAAQETHKKSTTQAADNTDKVITDNKDTAAYSPAYTKDIGKSAGNTVKGHPEFKGSMSLLQMKNQAMKSYVQDTLTGKNTQGANDGYKALFGGSEVISNALAAAEKTSEKHDDYWGVDATAERIFTFAKSLAGEDEEMLSKMKDAFLKGFDQALGVKKGKLPDISYQTKDKVLEMFDAYEKELSGAVSSTDNDEKTDETKKEETKSSGKTSYVGAGKYGTSAAPTKYSGGKTVSYIGNEKYGSSYEATKTN